MEFFFFYKGPFSQWHERSFEVDDIKYNCAEQYMMHQKALFFKDKSVATLIMAAKHPGDQKALGRAVSPFDETQWNSVARDIVYKGNWHKFSQNPDFLHELNQTGNTTLVEASPTDRIWGIGLGMRDERRLNRQSWRGTNWLGQVLTKVRDDLRKGVQEGPGFQWE